MVVEVLSALSKAVSPAESDWGCEVVVVELVVVDATVVDVVVAGELSTTVASALGSVLAVVAA